MSRDGRLNIRLGAIYPHLIELANRDRRSSKRRPVSDFIFDELEKIVIKRCPEYRPEPIKDRRLVKPQRI
jgi:hypothetical protein